MSPQEVLGETVANFIAGYDDVSKRIPDDCELEADVIVASFAKKKALSEPANGSEKNGKPGKSRESDESGNGGLSEFTPRVCRVKDWPASGEEFGEAFPAQTLDLLKNLPMMGYTARNSLLNMTAILPDVFVRPDLGPRATISHGVGVRDSAPDVGTVHLHVEKADSLSALGEQLGMGEISGNWQNVAFTFNFHTLGIR